MYFEPAYNGEYLQPAADPALDRLGYGPVQNRGVQNVPCMNTVGVQYTVDQTGSTVPAGTVPAGPSFYQPSQSNCVQYPTIITGDESGLPIGSKIQGGTLPRGSGGPYFYQASPSAYTLPHGPQPVTMTSGTTLAGPGGEVGVQPMVLSGSSCPLCGRQDYHVHSDGVVVNSANNDMSGAASRRTVPVGVTPAQPAFLARCKHFKTFHIYYAQRRSEVVLFSAERVCLKSLLF